MSTLRSSDSDLEKSRRAKEVSSNLLAAAENRARLAELDPTMSGSPQERTDLRKDLRAGPVDRFRKGLGDGLEISGLRSALQSAPDNNASWKPSPKEIFERRTSIMRAVAQSGRAEDIPKIMEALTPYMEVSGGDPLMSLLIPRLSNNNGGEKLGLREVLEIIKLGNELRGPPQPQNQSDPAAMASAMVGAVKVGIEAAKNNNGSSLDPVAVLRESSESTKAMLESQRDFYKTQLELNKTQKPGEYLKELRAVQDLFAREPEDREIALRRIDGLSEERRMAFELEKERWHQQISDRQDANKAKREGELVRTVVGAIQKIGEQPLVRELGKSVGKKIGVPENPIAAANTRAAQETLRNPMDVPYSFVCSRCKQSHAFTSGQLTKIASNGGRWVCPTEGCAEPYVLKGMDSPSGSTKRDKDDGDATVA